jgi:hypothetical protein
MRLQLNVRQLLRGAIAAAAAIAALAAAGARAEPVVLVDGRSAIYNDSDATFISTSTVALRGNPIERLSLKGRVLVDVISTASVDVVSAATDRWDEVRKELEGAIAYRDGTRTASVAYIHSTEEDWLSHTFSAGASHDFADHTITLGLGGSIGLNDVGRADDDNFHRDLNSFSGSLDATYVATRWDLLSATYSLSYLAGYQASPYRFATIADPDVPGLVFGAPEAHPETRVRHALSLRWLRHLFSDSAIRSQVRLYGDSWALLSVTAAAEYVIGLGDLELGLIARGYAQRHALFYEDVYDAPRRYMTADRELSNFFDVFGGGRVGYRHGFAESVLEELRAELKVEGFAFRFTEFSRLPSRTGVIGELALGASF